MIGYFTDHENLNENMCRDISGYLNGNTGKKWKRNLFNTRGLSMPAKTSFQMSHFPQTICQSTTTWRSLYKSISVLDTGLRCLTMLLIIALISITCWCTKQPLFSARFHWGT